MKIEAKHIEAEVFCLKGWIEEINPERLQNLFQEYLEAADFSILNVVSNRFPHNGFTAVWVLAESHLAIHTFSESGWTYFELTSCNKAKSMHFKQNIASSGLKLKFDSSNLEKSAI